MKKLIFLCIASTFIFSCQEKKEQTTTDGYEISISVDNIPNGIRAYLKNSENPNNLIATDSAIVRNGRIDFKGSVVGSQPRQLFINSVIGSLPLIVDNSKLDIDLDEKNILNSKVSGSKANDDLFKFIGIRNVMSNELKEMTIKRQTFNKTADPVGYNKFNQTIRAKSDSIKNYAFEFIKENPDSDFSLILLASQVGGIVKNANKYEEALEQLEGIINKDESSKALAKKVEDFINQAKAKDNLEVGKVAPKFTAPNPDGKMIALDDIKGKVTIIDFWAAWCGPCRRENPNVVKVYEKYHDKGLEIIGVSLDGNSRQQDPKASWLKAIEDDKLDWHHVSNLKYFNDPVAKLYEVKAIPRTYILDENGKIVAKNLRGKALEDKIAALLN